MQLPSEKPGNYFNGHQTTPLWVQGRSSNAIKGQALKVIKKKNKSAKREQGKSDTSETINKNTPLSG